MKTKPLLIGVAGLLVAFAPISAYALNPQPLPPGLRTALNPQPLPPGFRTPNPFPPNPILRSYPPQPTQVLQNIFGFGPLMPMGF